MGPGLSARAAIECAYFMKFFYAAALLVPSILAADVGMRDTQFTDAQSMDNAGGPAAVQQLIKKECPDLTPDCIESVRKLQDAVKKMATGKGKGLAGGPSKECFDKVTACTKKINPKLAAANGRA